MARVEWTDPYSNKHTQDYGSRISVHAVVDGNEVHLGDVDSIDNNIETFYDRKVKRERQERFEKDTLEVFQSYNRLRYDKQFMKKHGRQRKKGTEDWLLKLSLLLSGVKNDDYRMEEIVFLRDYFRSKVRLVDEIEANELVEEINAYLLSKLTVGR